MLPMWEFLLTNYYFSTDSSTNIDNNFSCINPVFNKYDANFGGSLTVYTPVILSSYNE